VELVVVGGSGVMILSTVISVCLMLLPVVLIAYIVTMSFWEIEVTIREVFTPCGKATS
jgi:hypothetical protein